MSSETLLLIHSSGSDDNIRQQQPSYEELTRSFCVGEGGFLVDNLTDILGAISSLCFPLSAHEAKLRDWKQLCQGEDAGDLLDKISVFSSAQPIETQVTMSLSSLVAEVSPIFRFNEVKCAIVKNNPHD